MARKVHYKETITQSELIELVNSAYDKLKEKVRKYLDDAAEKLKAKGMATPARIIVVATFKACAELCKELLKEKFPHAVEGDKVLVAVEPPVRIVKTKIVVEGGHIVDKPVTTREIRSAVLACRFVCLKNIDKLQTELREEAEKVLAGKE